MKVGAPFAGRRCTPHIAGAVPTLCKGD